MSRIGLKPINIPEGVEVKISRENFVTVKGPKATLEGQMTDKLGVSQRSGVIHVSREDDSKEKRELHGLTRTLINNMILGVTEGFKKELEIHGIGYRAAKQGDKLVLTVGYTHPVTFTDGDGIIIEVPAPNKIIVTGPDKQKVGQIAAEIRDKRRPEPYKGKGIRYVGEYVIRKEGKAGKAS